MRFHSLLHMRLLFLFFRLAILYEERYHEISGNKC